MFPKAFPVALPVNGICLVLPWLVGSIFAQVNTESMRVADPKRGLQGKLKLDLSFADGNTSFLKTDNSARLDWVKETVSTMVVGNYQLGQTTPKDSEQRERFLHKSFLHLRGNLYPHQAITYELFGQIEFNEFLNLDLRVIEGGGIRLNLFPHSQEKGWGGFFGVGLMWESERYKENTEENQTDLLRSTNYINLQANWRSIQFSNTGYLQFAANDRKDLRILNDLELEFQVASFLSLRNHLALRFDNQPPQPKDPTTPRFSKHDLELGTGITFRY